MCWTCESFNEREPYNFLCLRVTRLTCGKQEQEPKVAIETRTKVHCIASDTENAIPNISRSYLILKSKEFSQLLS